MTARLDHITVVAPTLESGSAYVEAALGVAPGEGRAHPGMGTHNLLLALGPTVYLEVISPDPRAAPVTRPRWFGLDHVVPGSAARLRAWVASTDDRRLRIRHPEPAQVLALFEKIGLASQSLVTVVRADECSLVAEIQTPLGPRELGEA